MGTEEKPKKRTGSFGKDHLKQEPPAAEDKEGMFRSDIHWQHGDAISKSRQPAKSVTFESDALPPPQPVELEFEPLFDAPASTALEELPAGNATAEEIQSLAIQMLQRLEERADTREMLTEIIKQTPPDSEVRNIALVGLTMAEEQPDPEIKEILRKDTLRQLAHQPAELIRFVKKGQRSSTAAADPIKRLAQQTIEKIKDQDDRTVTLIPAVEAGYACLVKIKIKSPPRSMARLIADETLELTKSADLKTRYSLYVDALNQIANVAGD